METLYNLDKLQSKKVTIWHKRKLLIPLPLSVFTLVGIWATSVFYSWGPALPGIIFVATGLVAVIWHFGLFITLDYRPTYEGMQKWLNERRGWYERQYSSYTHRIQAPRYDLIDSLAHYEDAIKEFPDVSTLRNLHTQARAITEKIIALNEARSAYETVNNKTNSTAQKAIIDIQSDVTLLDEQRRLLAEKAQQIINIERTAQAEAITAKTRGYSSEVEDMITAARLEAEVASEYVRSRKS